MKEQKKGISLIVLVITIIVMIILASAVIISLSNSNIITKAKEAVLKTDVKNFAGELSVSLAEQKLNNKDLEFGDVTETDVEEIKKYIPNFDEKYAGKIFIQNGELVYDASKVTANEKAALESIGIKSGTTYTPAELKQVIESKNLGTDVSTTDITKYVEGLSQKDAEKYTIFQGKLYYRYDKTTIEDRLLLHQNGVSYLLGDANGNGTLDEEDIKMIETFSSNYNYTNQNVITICDVNNDLVIDNADSSVVYETINNNDTLENYIDMALQEPYRVRITLDYWKAVCEVEISDNIPDTAVAAGYTELVKYLPELKNDYFAERVALIHGFLHIRLDRLTELEKDAWLNGLVTDPDSARFTTLIGDGNYDGYVTEADSAVLQDIIDEKIVATDVQKYVLDINNDGAITIEDKTMLDDYLAGTIDYLDFF